MPQKWSVSLAVWVVVLGLYSAISGAVAAKNWGAYTAGTQTYYGVSLVAGAVAAGFGAWLLMRRALGARVKWGVPLVLAVLTVNQAAGLIGNTILCFTPG